MAQHFDPADLPEDLAHDWTEYMRFRFEQGRRTIASGSATEMTPDSLMDAIENELGIAQEK